MFFPLKHALARKHERLFSDQLHAEKDEGYAIVKPGGYLKDSMSSKWVYRPHLTKNSVKIYPTLAHLYWQHLTRNSV